MILLSIILYIALHIPFFQETLPERTPGQVGDVGNSPDILLLFDISSFCNNVLFSCLLITNLHLNIQALLLTHTLLTPLIL